MDGGVRNEIGSEIEASHNGRLGRERGAGNEVRAVLTKLKKPCVNGVIRAKLKDMFAVAAFTFDTLNNKYKSE